MAKVKDNELVSFLNNHSEKGETKILTKGKEYDELIEIAKARDYDVEGSRTLKLFKNTYGFIDKANGNGANLPKEVLAKLPTIIGKPVNLNHQKSYVVGHFIDYRYNAEKKEIIAYGVFYKNNFPSEYQNLQKKFKSGKLGTSFETIHMASKVVYHCGTCGNEQSNEKGERVTCSNCGEFLFAYPNAKKNYKGYCSKKHVRDIILEEFSGGCMVTKDGLQAEEDAMVSEFAMLQDSLENDNEITMGVSVDKEIQAEKKELLPNEQTEEVKEEVIGNEIDTPENKDEDESVKDDEEPKVEVKIKELKVMCSCRANAWKILSENENEADVECIYCKNKYNLQFDEGNPLGNLGTRKLLVGAYTCPTINCNSTINYNVFSNDKEVKLRCKKCGISFGLDLNKKTSVEKNVKSMVAIGEEKAMLKGESKDMGRVDKLKGIKEAIKSEEQKMSVEKVKEDVKAEETKVENEEVVVVEESKELKDKLAKLEAQLAESESKVKVLEEKSKTEIDEFKVKAQQLIENAKKIAERRNELGEFAEDLSDEQILDETQYALAKLKRENKTLQEAIKENAQKAIETKKLEEQEKEDETEEEITVSKVTEGESPVVGESAFVNTLNELAEGAKQNQAKYKKQFVAKPRTVGYNPNK